MIVAVCLNAALDVTYPVAQLRVGMSHRVERPVSRAGGKGSNVARVLHQLGSEVVLLGFAGGPTGRAIQAELADDGVGARLTAIADDSRRTVTIVDGDAATVFSEAGPVVSAAEWQQLLVDFADVLPAARVVVLSGSLPRGVPSTAYADLTTAAVSAGVLVIVDADGPALIASLAANPSVVKPNDDEARAALELDAADPFAVAEDLVRRGARTAVVSCGAEGLVAVIEGRSLRVRPATAVPGNPTGAGDALAAGLARGLASGTAWPELLADAVAIAAGAVAVAHAGAIDPSVVEAARADVVVEEC